MKILTRIATTMFLLSYLALSPFLVYGQSMGATVITQGGNTANVTSGHALQIDVTSVAGTGVTGQTAGSVPVTIVSGAGSGGTAAADEATFTPGTTNYTPSGCFFQTTSTNNLLTNLQGGWAQCTARRAQFVDLDAWAGTTLGTPTNFGSTPGAVIAGSVNSSVFLGTVASATAASGVQKVGIVGNAGAAFDAATGAAPPANAILMGGLGSGATGGFMIGIPVADTSVSVNITSAVTTRLVTGVSGRQVRIGAYEMYVGAADNIEFVEGTGATCGTGTAGMIGGATTGLSQVFSAAGGVVHGSGLGTVLQTVTTGDSVCLVTSTSANVGINLQYAIY